MKTRSLLKPNLKKGSNEITIDLTPTLKKEVNDIKSHFKSRKSLRSNSFKSYINNEITLDDYDEVQNVSKTRRKLRSDDPKPLKIITPKPSKNKSVSDINLVEDDIMMVQSVSKKKLQFQCPKCTFSTDSSKFFKMHQTGAHGKKVMPKKPILNLNGEVQKILKCSICARSFLTIQGLDKHYRSAHGKVTEQKPNVALPNQSKPNLTKAN